MHTAAFQAFNHSRCGVRLLCPAWTQKFEWAKRKCVRQRNKTSEQSSGAHKGYVTKHGYITRHIYKQPWHSRFRKPSFKERRVSHARVSTSNAFAHHPSRNVVDMSPTVNSFRNFRKISKSRRCTNRYMICLTAHRTFVSQISFWHVCCVSAADDRRSVHMCACGVRSKILCICVCASRICRH